MSNAVLQKTKPFIPVANSTKETTDNKPVVNKVFHQKTAKNDHCLLHACECMRQR